MQAGEHGSEILQGRWYSLTSSWGRVEQLALREIEGLALSQSKGCRGFFMVYLL